MREKEVETRKLCTKRKKKRKNEDAKFEQMSQNSHLGGTSFTVDSATDRLHKWKRLFYTRYYLHLGRRDDISVCYKSIIDSEGNDVEERYMIVTKGKDKMSLSITIYYNTERILIQGNNKKEWINNEFNKLKSVIDNAETEKDIVQSYSSVYKIPDTTTLTDEDKEIDIVVEKLVNDKSLQK